MPSICGLGPAGWQETCDPGMGIFGYGGGAAWRASTRPWIGSLDAQRCCLAAAGSQVRHQQPLIPTLRGPRGR